MNADLVFLAQTDTTIGFLSKDKKKLQDIKKRSENKNFIKIVKNLKILKDHTRVPLKHKNMVRRSKKTTFVYSKTKAVRVNTSSRHQLFLDKFDWFYTTSANKSTQSYNEYFAKENANIIVLDYKTLEEKQSSAIIVLSKNKKARLR
jgi:tRNA A37 threonylcarbamoyladenosine synthetase subunit TsaC/SUA5/YrdC